MTSSKQVLLGAFFVIVLSILGYYTLFLTDFSLFKETRDLVVHFPDAHGLRTGDPVLVAGMRRGRVRELTYDPGAPLERRITVALLMDEEVPLRAGFDVRIEDATLLGGRQVYIDPGPPEGGPVASGEALLGRVAGNPLGELGDFVSENRAAVGRIVTEVEAFVAGINEGRGLIGRLATDDEMARTVSAGLESLRSTADDAAAISADLRAGKGPLGKLLTDADLEAKLQQVADDLGVVSRNLASVSTDLEAGRGVAGALFKDDALANEVREAVSTVKDIVSRINDADGTLWRLIVDPAIADDVAAILRGVREGEGALGMLLTREEVYERLSEIADNLARASRAIVDAEGSLGKLVMEPDLYVEVERAMGIVTRTLEEFREAAPVTTFTSVLFGAF